MNALDHTHDPAAQSWVASANLDGADFPLQNLPWARARLHAGDDWRIRLQRVDLMNGQAAFDYVIQAWV